MFKSIWTNTWVFDVEWIPDPVMGRVYYKTPPGWTDAEVIELMYAKARETMAEKTGRPAPERPYLKLALCRVVALAAIKRVKVKDGVTLELKVQPDIGLPMGERTIVNGFLQGVGKTKPQLVGYNITEADIPMLLQRAIAHQLWQPEFGRRPGKPWEGVDYFAGKHGDAVLDLLEMLGAYGQAKPTLDELCVSCGIPGKTTKGGDVVDLWLNSDYDAIVRYVRGDVFREYELFLRCLLLSGQVSPAEYAREERAFIDLLSTMNGEPDVAAYLQERERLRSAMTYIFPPAPPPTQRPQLDLIAPAPASPLKEPPPEDNGVGEAPVVIDLMAKLQESLKKKEPTT